MNSFVDTQTIPNNNADEDVISTSIREKFSDNIETINSPFGISSFPCCAETLSSLRDNVISVQEVK